MISSGPVPRELMPGVVWCEKAEAEFAEVFSGLMRKYQSASNAAFAHENPEDCATREARWVVEIKLHQRFMKARVQDAMRCVSPDAKRRLVADWKREYGVERTDRLIAIVKSDKLKQTVLEAW